MALDPKLQKFTTAGPVLANYSYTDVAEGTGMQQFYLCSSEDSTGTDYHLVGNVIYSEDLYRQFATGTDVDFDLSQFNFPKTILGTGILQIAYRIAGASGSAYIICRLRKYSGATETTLVSVTSPTLATGQQGIWNMPITIPRTDFAKGDILRLTIEGYQGGVGIASIGMDPQNREAAGIMTLTQSSIFIPFDLGL